MPRIGDKELSTRVAADVLERRGLSNQSTVDELAGASSAHDIENKGYLSRDELELGASDVARRVLGAPGTEVSAGLSFDRAALDAAKVAAAKAGLRLTDDDVLRAVAALGVRQGTASPETIALACRALVETSRLRALEHPPTPPARPSIQAQTPDADARLGRRKLASSYQHSGGPVKVAFFDADSTIRVSRSGNVSASSATDVALLPFVADKMRELHEQGYLVAIVSNQAGVEDGHVTIDDADAALMHAVDLIRSLGGEVHYVDFAESRGPDRKPNGGMADRLERLLTSTFGPTATIDLGASFMCGDSAYKRTERRPDGRMGSSFSNADRCFAETIGVRFEEPNVTFGWDALGVRQIDDLRQRDALLERFDAGRRATTSPLFARFALP